jgi:hypothetical protein
VAEPPFVPPDDKIWTWVLERPCPECGFDGSEHPRDRFASEIRALAGTYRQLLGDPDVSRRPEPTVWSALEYGCHVRDVFDVFARRVSLMITEDDPAFPNWDQDETALAERYWEQDPGRVAYQLGVAAGKIADLFDKVRPEQWARTGRRSDGSTFTIESLGTYLLHDPVHHVWDIRRGFEALSEEAPPPDPG